MTFDINKIVRKNIVKLKPYSSARDIFTRDMPEGKSQEVIFLDANENPFQNGANRYPDPKQQSVKGLLSDLKGISTDNILLGNGSDEILDMIFRAFCEPQKDNIIFSPPTYGMYKVLGELNNVETKEVILSKSFDLRVNKILSATNENSKILFLCSPNNPSGNSFTEEKIKTLLEKFKGLVVIDEAYIDFSKKNGWLDKLKKYPNLIIIQTFSKAFGMAGIRLGICYASVEIIEILNRIKPPYNVSELSQQRAIKCLKNFDSVKNEITKIILERENLEKQLKFIPYIRKIYPSDANFILIKVDDAHKRYRQLLEKGIVTRNRTALPLCKNTLRFTVGTPEENKKLIKVLLSI